MSIDLLRSAKRFARSLQLDVSICWKRVKDKRPRQSVLSSVAVTPLSSEGMHTFFGYYDISPFHGVDERVLACRVSADKHVAPGKTLLQLGYYNRSFPKQFITYAATSTWCWQQGARLQWHAALGNDIVFFNGTSACANAEKPCGVLFDIGTGKCVAHYAMPVYALHEQSGRALGLDFMRLQRLRPGYGYMIGEEHGRGSKAPDNDGIYFMAGPESPANLIFTIDEASRLFPTASMAGAEHYFNHLCWSPSGKRFMVIHAWHSPQTGKHTRILTLNSDGTDPRVLTFDDRASHYWWLDDSSLLLYAAHGRTSCYFSVTDSPTPSITLISGLPEGDGHPSLSPCKRWILGDTLSDQYSERSLWIYDQSVQRLKTIATFYSPLTLRGEVRCDLHPRWDRLGQCVAVDSAHSGNREMLLLDLSAFVLQDFNL